MSLFPGSHSSIDTNSSFFQHLKTFQILDILFHVGTQKTMEHIGAICEGEWSSLSGMYSNEEADFMAQLLANCPPSDELDGNTSLGNQSTLWPSYGSTMNMAGVNQNSYFSFDIGDNTSSLWFSQGSSYNGASSALFPSSSQESYYLSDSNPILITNHSSMSMDFCMGDTNNTGSYLIEGDDCSNQEMSDGTAEDQSGGSQSVLGLDVKILPPKMESEMQAPEPVTDEKLNNPSENSKKRSRNSADVSVIRSILIMFIAHLSTLSLSYQLAYILIIIQQCRSKRRGT